MLIFHIFYITVELFPLDVRAELSGAANCLASLYDFISVKTYPQLSSNLLLDVYGTFWLYSSICLLGLIYGIFFLPETKGRRLEEINTTFMSEKSP